MRPAEGRPPSRIDLRDDAGSQIKRALPQLAEVEHEAPFPQRVEHLKLTAGPCKPAGVADLTTRLAVEGSAVEHHGHALVMPDLNEPIAERILRDDADHLALGLGGVVAHKL